MALKCQDVRSPVGASAPLEYARPFMLIGRHPAADLCLNDVQISRRHVYLQAVGGRVFCLDLESRTKVYWDGEQDARSRGWLDPGRSILVGPYRIHRTEQPTGDHGEDSAFDPLIPLDEEGALPGDLPRVALELPFRTGGTASTWPMNSLLALVGRSDRCQLVLTDRCISKHHACLVRTPLGLWVIDLAAREGVQINGIPVRWAWLADGDLIRVGLFTLVLRYETPPEGICRQDVPLEAGASPPAPTGGAAVTSAERLGTDRRAVAVRSRVGTPSVTAPQSLVSRVPPPAPAPSLGGEWEPVSPPGPSPITIWQQQMQLMETFHHDMIMMVQMFIAMHREHLSSVRGELDRVQQLTNELNLLNARLGDSAGPKKASPAKGAGRRRADARPIPQSDPSRRQHGALPPVADRTGQAKSRSDRGRTDVSSHPSRRVPRADNSKQGATAPSPPAQSPELYAELTRRITELQKERQGYWEKILNVINK
jgi:pSer/pThr/pTyr-binding forkhead associated (FHA) protein